MDTTSHWIASGSLPRFPKLGKDLTVDVVIVGGGITGITAAYLCQKAGLSFALIERDRLARMDTGHTSAHLTSVTDLRLFEIAENFGQHEARAVWDAGAAAIDQIVKHIRTDEIPCDFKWTPGYLHAPDSDPAATVVDELLKEAAAARDLNIRSDFTPNTPFFGGPGIKFPHQGIFHPRKYLAGLVRSFGGKGTHIFEQTCVDEIQDQPLAVKAGSFTVQCGHVILATHTPLQGTSGTLSALLFQTKLALYTSYALSAKLPAQGMEGMFWDTNDPYYYLRIEHRRGYDLAIFGGEDHKTGQADNTEDAFHRLEERFQKIFPDAKFDRRWSGQVIETNDGLPYIGSTSVNQFVATGFSGNGMTFGTLGAMMAIDSIFARRNPWTSLFNVHRKKVAGGAWEYIKENKDYPYYMLRDWLGSAEATSLSSLQRSKGKIVSLDGKKVAAYRDHTGKITVCSAVCPHLGCIVGWNDAEHTWDCPCHGSRFRCNGEVISGPAEENLQELPVPTEKETARTND
jgi:glycine/D-amino acid oxidase-like deaminating enzyme/nitrite reductase/ring-hydroxylating ferredoxin subunit